MTILESNPQISHARGARGPRSVSGTEAPGRRQCSHVLDSVNTSFHNSMVVKASKTLDVSVRFFHEIEHFVNRHKVLCKLGEKYTKIYL